jgi:hypothetical protein
VAGEKPLSSATSRMVMVWLLPLARFTCVSPGTDILPEFSPFEICRNVLIQPRIIPGNGMNFPRRTARPAYDSLKSIITGAERNQLVL